MGEIVHLTGKDIALTGMFSALFVVLNLTLGPLSFRLVSLPVLHDIGVFLTLLLTTWVTRKFGPSLVVGIVGSVIAILAGGPIIIVGFAISAVLFDLLMSACRHNIQLSKFSLGVTISVTLISAYFAGAIIGIFFMGNGIVWAISVWGGWHLVGGILALCVTLPIIVGLEKSGVRKLRTN